MRVLPAHQPADLLDAIRQHLRSPRPRRVEPFSDLHPGWHAPPVLPDWVPPRDPQAVHALLDRLPPRQCVICARVAASLVLGLWLRAAEENQWRPSWRLAPIVALRNLRRWLAGNFRMTDLGDSVDNLLLVIDGRASGHRHPQALTWAGWHRYPGMVRGRRCWDLDPSLCPPDAWALIASSFATMCGAYSGESGETDRRSRTWRTGESPQAIAAVAVAAASNAGLAAAGEPGPRRIPMPLSPPQYDAFGERQQRFMDAWWARCTAALAIRDADRAWLS